MKINGLRSSVLVPASNIDTRDVLRRDGLDVPVRARSSRPDLSRLAESGGRERRTAAFRRDRRRLGSSPECPSHATVVLEPYTGGVLARATFTLEATFEPRAARS